MFDLWAHVIKYSCVKLLTAEIESSVFKLFYSRLGGGIHFLILNCHQVPKYHINLSYCDVHCKCIRHRLVGENSYLLKHVCIVLLFINYINYNYILFYRLLTIKTMVVVALLFHIIYKLLLLLYPCG